MRRFIKELYLTAFVIFFRIARDAWSHNVNAGKGVAGVTLIEVLLAIAIEGWIEIFFWKALPRLPQWAFFVAFFILCGANHYPLVTCGHGIVFEREFTHLKRSRKLLLVAASGGFMLAAIMFFGYSGFVHRRFIEKL